MAKISRRSQRYWAERKARELYENLIPVEEAAEDLRSLYYQASREIEKEAAKIVTKFADLHHLTIEEAEALLDTVLDPKDMKAITRALRADPTKQELVAQLDAPAYAARINRLAKMQDQVDEVVSKLLTPVGDTFNDVLTEIGQRSYYQSLFGFQERTGVDFPILPIEEEKLAEILNTRWFGKNYSERLWDNTEKLATSVKRELAIGVLTGKSRHDMSQAIRDEFGSASYETRRLIRTEATYVSGQMDLVSYRQMGVTEYEYIAILDARTSEICRDLDGKRFPVDSAQPGVNYPPMHPWCRSSTTPALPKGLDDLLTVTSYDENGNERKETLTEARAAREELATNSGQQYLTANISPVDIEPLRMEDLPQEVLDKTARQIVGDKRIVSGVEPGKPMTQLEANANNTNPGFYSAMAAQEGRKDNCQTGAVVFEARLRGYDLEALPFDPSSSFMYKLQYDPDIAWASQINAVFDDLTPADVVYLSDHRLEFQKLLYERLESGARYHVYFGHNGAPAGHVVTLTKETQGLLFYDPQNGRYYDDRYLDCMRISKIGQDPTVWEYFPRVYRVDNLDFNYDCLNDISVKHE